MFRGTYDGLCGAGGENTNGEFRKTCTGNVQKKKK